LRYFINQGRLIPVHTLFGVLAGQTWCIPFSTKGEKKVVTYASEKLAGKKARVAKKI
jgi:hypothetical protein